MKFKEIEEKIKNVNDINQLFDLWKEAHQVEDEVEKTKAEKIPTNSFIEDGYVCNDVKDYNKILFVLKESNETGNSNTDEYRGEQYTYYRNYINSGKDNTPKMLEKIGRMAHYILTREIKENSEFKNSLRNIAFMNINKRGGGNNADDKIFNAYCIKYKAFIEKQIELLNPDIIICLGTYKFLKMQEVGIINNDNENKFIDMWHPAYQMSGQTRNNEYDLKDKNVDLYVQEFIKRYNEKFEK